MTLPTSSFWCRRDGRCKATVGTSAAAGTSGAGKGPSAGTGSTAVTDASDSSGDWRCPSAQVCPPGYTQCPDRSCIPGIGRFNVCKPQKLPSCERRLPDGSIVKFIRCPGDGNSCAETYEDCPSLVTCSSSEDVVCPDGSCRPSAILCLNSTHLQHNHPSVRSQPLLSLSDYKCNDATPYQCPGL